MVIEAIRFAKVQQFIESENFRAEKVERKLVFHHKYRFGGQQKKAVTMQTSKHVRANVEDDLEADMVIHTFALS